MVRIIAVMVLLATASEATRAADLPPPSDEAIDALVNALANNTLAGPARQELERLPARVVVPSIVKALTSGELRASGPGRARAYELLKHHGTGEDPTVRKCFLAGLRDPYRNVKRICAEALGPLLASELEEVASQLANRGVSGQHRQDLLRMVEGWGPAARFLLDVARSILVNPATEELTRWLAARVTLDMEAFAELGEVFDRLDAVGKKVVLWALTQFWSEVDSGDRTIDERNISYRTTSGELTLKGMRSEDGETRKAAFQGLLPVWGLEGYAVIRSRDDYELNPKIKAALSEMAASDPDPSLRETAAHSLEPEYLDKVVAKAFRERERQRKDVDE